MALQAVQKYLQPRRIHVVTETSSQCSAFSSWGPNIQCYLQDRFLRDVTKASIAAGLQRRFHASGGQRFKGRDLSGWYLQQFVKLGAPSAIPGLSQHFVVWDADMIPLRPMCFFRLPPHRIGVASPIQTEVAIGGVSPPGYALTYERLFGKPLTFAPDGSSFVAHWMVVYQPFLNEFLTAIAGSSGSTNASDSLQPATATWVDVIMDSLPPQHLDMGFSEYASYISFVRYRHPNSQHLAPTRSWLRYGLGGQAAIRLRRWLSPYRLCCPSRHLLLLSRLLGYTYSGLDIGHLPQCGLDDFKHNESYGVSIPI